MHPHGNPKSRSTKNIERGSSRGHNENESAVRRERTAPSFDDFRYQGRGILASRARCPPVGRVGEDRGERPRAIAETDVPSVADEELLRRHAEVREVLEGAPHHRGVSVDAVEARAEQPGLGEQRSGPRNGSRMRSEVRTRARFTAARANFGGRLTGRRKGRRGIFRSDGPARSTAATSSRSVWDPSAPATTQ